jgi:glucokinase
LNTFVAAVDIGATNQRIAIVDGDGRIRARRAEPVLAEPEQILDAIVQATRDLALGVDAGVRVDALGISIAAPFDIERGRTITLNPYASIHWDDTPIREILSASLGIPIIVENDGNAAAIGEGWTGAARGFTDYVMVAVGSALAVGIVINGRPHRGRRYFAGELSAFPVTSEQLRATEWDSIALSAGGTAAHTEAVRLFGDQAHARDLFDAAGAGHAEASAWVQRAQEHLAMALAQIAIVLDPDVIVLGGGVIAAQGESFVGPIRELFTRFPPGHPDVRISELGADAQLVGAARLALDGGAP